MSSWRPTGARPVAVDRVELDALVGWDHRVWTVIGTARREDSERPCVVVLRPVGVTTVQAHHDGDLHLGCKPWSMLYVYPDEHYPVCVRCQEPTPCREVLIEQAMAASRQRTARYEIPNVCPACQQPVTARQLRQTWPENLIALTGQPVTIHLRRECIREAVAYDALWVKAGHPSQLGNVSPAPP